MFPLTTYASTESEYTGKTYEKDSRLDNTIVVNGIDASCYQDTSSDWVKAKENGIDFAILRVTLTTANSGTLNTDNTFERHYNNAKEAGIMRGVYVFSQAKNKEEGKREAEFAIKRLQELKIEPKDLDLPVYMDYEFYHKEESRLSNLTRQDAIEAAEEFCKTVKSYGYQAGVYANSSFFASYLDDGKTLPDDVSIWCAQYNKSNESASNYSIWQYSSSGIVPNIYEAGSKKLDGVDVNFWYIDTSLNKKSTIEIYGNTNVEHTGKPVLPTLEVYDGSKKLKEGKDYTISGINNIYENSDAYAYVRGIGKYQGYALIPINIKSNEFVKLSLPTSIINTSYELKNSAVINVPDGITVKELLSEVSLTSEEYRLGIIDSQGVESFEDDEVCFSDLIGIFKDTTLVGTIDINLESETQINYLRKK